MAYPPHEASGGRAIRECGSRSSAMSVQEESSTDPRTVLLVLDGVLPRIVAVAVPIQFRRDVSYNHGPELLPLGHSAAILEVGRQGQLCTRSSAD